MVACGPGDDGPVGPGGDGTQAPNTEEGKDTPNLPDKKYGGMEFNFLTDKAQKWGYYPLDVDEISEDDAYANAIHERNGLVEDRLEIELVGMQCDGSGDVKSKFDTDVTTNANNFQACFGTVEMTLQSTYAGNTLPFSEIQYINLENDYWNQDCYEQLKLGGESYMNSGDIMLSDKEVLWAVYFIKSRIAQASLESPYDLVNNNQWTWDKMMEMAAAVAEDVDASDTMVINTSDIFGLCTHPENIPASWESAGLKTVQIGEDGMPYMAWGEDEFYTVYEGLKEIMNNKMVVSPKDIDFISTAITKNKTLFGTEVIAFVRSYRESENEFGIVPYPKYNSNVSRFNSYVAINSGVVSVGYTNPETEYIGIVLETMAWLGRDHLLPEYYDKQLKGRYASDRESAAMLDIIFNYRCYDIGALAKGDGIQWSPFNILVADNVNSASKWASSGMKAEGLMLDALAKLLNR